MKCHNKLIGAQPYEDQPQREFGLSHQIQLEKSNVDTRAGKISFEGNFSIAFVLSV